MACAATCAEVSQTASMRDAAVRVGHRDPPHLKSVRRVDRHRTPPVHLLFTKVHRLPPGCQENSESLPAAPPGRLPRRSVGAGAPPVARLAAERRGRTTPPATPTPCHEAQQRLLTRFRVRTCTSGSSWTSRSSGECRPDADRAPRGEHGADPLGGGAGGRRGAWPSTARASRSSYAAGTPSCGSPGCTTPRSSPGWPPSSANAWWRRHDSRPDSCDASSTADRPSAAISHHQPDNRR